MRIGIVILGDRRWSTAGARWRQAEEWGFDHAWTYDHLGWRDLVEGPWFDAVPTLTAAAGVTARMRLGTLVASPNFRHPVSLARQVTTLDDVSGGRFVLGVGAGGLGFDAAVLGAPELTARERVDRFGEFLELLDRLLRAGRDGVGVDWAGRYYRAVAARTDPGCAQSPRVPFVVAANGPRSMRLAARFGQGWVTYGGVAEDMEGWWRVVAAAAERMRRELDAAGRDPAGFARYLSLDGAPVFSLSSVGFFADVVERSARLGFTDVITHWPRESSWYAGDESVLVEVATTVLPQLRGVG